MSSAYDLFVFQKKSVRSCLAAVLLASCLVASQSEMTRAWTPTSPQFSVAVFRGTSNNYGQSVVLDSSGNIYTTGTFAGTADFDPGDGIANLTSTGGNDVFVSKLDMSGNYVWAKGFGGTNGESGYSVAVDSLGNVYTTGIFQGTADFDPGSGIANMTSVGSDDVFV